MEATDCQDLYENGRNATGVYHLPIHGRDVLCEMEGGDGGWLVMQRRARVHEQVSHVLNALVTLLITYPASSSPFPHHLTRYLLLPLLQVNFNRVWDEYKRGFGDVETEFWIGNDFLHVLTNQKVYQLHIDFQDYEKGPYWVAYR